MSDTITQLREFMQRNPAGFIQGRDFETLSLAGVRDLLGERDGPAHSTELDPLTDAEREVLESFASAWRLFALLPRRHPDELSEARAHLHALQQTLMARAAVRAYPDLFTSIEGFR